MAGSKIGIADKPQLCFAIGVFWNLGALEVLPATFWSKIGLDRFGKKSILTEEIQIRNYYRSLTI